MAAAAIAEGRSLTEAAERAGVDRTTLWKHRNDPDWQQALYAALEAVREAVTSDAVARSVAQLRELAPKAVEALDLGLQARHKAQVVKLRDPEGGEGYVIADVPDVSLAVKTADIVSKRIAELAPRSKVDVEVSGTLEARLAELDARGDTASD